MRKNIFKIISICLFMVLLFSCAVVDNTIDEVLPVQTCDCTVVFLNKLSNSNYYEGDYKTQKIPIGTTQNLYSCTYDNFGRTFLGWRIVDILRKISDMQSYSYQSEIVIYERRGYADFDYFDGEGFTPNVNHKRDYVVVLMAIWEENQWTNNPGESYDPYDPDANVSQDFEYNISMIYEPNIELGDSITVIKGDDFKCEISGNSDDFSVYEWRFDGILIPNEQGKTVTISTDDLMIGVYELVCVVVDANGEKYTASVEVRVVREWE